MLFGSEEISQEREDQESPKQMKEIERNTKTERERKKQTEQETYNSYSYAYFFSGLLSGSINQKRSVRKKENQRKEKRNIIIKK